MMGEQAGPGFFGKLPSRGDFVTRRLAADFLGPWDAWLQAALAQSRTELGGEWLDVYLTSPIWRFALSPGACGEQGYVGVMMPSVDKVGRYFPLAAALPCGSNEAPFTAALELDEWYGELEELLLETLAEAPLDLEVFDARLAGLAVATAALAGGGAAPVADDAAAYRHWPLESHARLRESPAAQSASRLASALGRHCLWWTQGSERVAPCVLLTSGLPAAEAFTAMLDGRFGARGWTSAAMPAAAAVPLHGVSAGVSDPGKKRAVNEDAYACSDAAGVWVVADGLGGHQAGDTASRMVASVVRHLGGPARPAEQVERLVLALHVVNDCLQAMSARSGRASVAASTVAALLARGNEAFWIWAGDSRVYRLRDGELAQLTRDHSEGDRDAGNMAVTRAVGGVRDLALDVERGDLRDGDRFLLCTDGLYSEVDRQTLAAALAMDDPSQGCERLKAAALAGAATDNLTAVVVHVGRAAAGVGV